MTEPRLTLIDLDQELPGQQRFISCWVSRGRDLTLVIDPGPQSTADHLIGRLQALGISKLDFILLTHLHLDHAGATAAVLDTYPGARVVCHEAAGTYLALPDGAVYLRPATPPRFFPGAGSCVA